jgi:hypothetical protein
MPDPSLPLPNQLEIALRKIKENIQVILKTQATCKSLEEVIGIICILISILLGMFLEFLKYLFTLIN